MLGLAACQTPVPGAPGAARPSVVVEEAEAWRQVASPRDSALLDGLPARWGTALAAARAAGLSKRLDAERTLLLPSARLARAAPAPGPYRCRSIRLGERRWTASAPAYCFVGVEQGQLTLATEIKGLHVGGYLWELKEGDGLVFLGALAPGAGKAATAYGESPASDSATSAIAWSCPLPRPESLRSSRWSRRPGHEKAARRRPLRSFG
jgi:hypothetical protein